jgi:hypothetical protein
MGGVFSLCAASIRQGLHGRGILLARRVHSSGTPSPCGLRPDGSRCQYWNEEPMHGFQIGIKCPISACQNRANCILLVSVIYDDHNTGDSGRSGVGSTRKCRSAHKACRSCGQYWSTLARRSMDPCTAGIAVQTGSN